MKFKPTSKSLLTPYPCLFGRQAPKGGLPNSMIVRCSPPIGGLGVKQLKIIEYSTFRSKLKFKLFIVFCLLLAGQFGFAQTTRVNSFDHLMESLNSGERVRIIIDYAKCGWQDTTKQSPVPEAIAGMDIGTYEYFAPGAIRNQKAFVVFSNAVLIENPIGQGFVYNYGKVRIYEDQSVQVTAKYVHSKRFKVLMNEVFIGKINDGQNGEAINLYK